MHVGLQTLVQPVITTALQLLQQGNAPPGIAAMLADLVHSYGMPESQQASDAGQFNVSQSDGLQLASQQPCWVVFGAVCHGLHVHSMPQSHDVAEQVREQAGVVHTHESARHSFHIEYRMRYHARVQLSAMDA